MKKIFRFINFFLIIFAIIFTYLGFEKHQGNSFYYVIFSIIVNLFFIYSLNSKRLFLEIFFSTLIWLGFWFKYTMSIVFLNGVLYDSGPLSNISNIDKAFTPSIVAILAIFLSYALRQKFFPVKIIYNNELSFFEKIYLLNRKLIIFLFIIFFLIISYYNFQFSIYQKGFLYPHNISPLITNIVKWILLFGLTTFSSFLLYTEILRLKKVSIITVLVVFIEIFVSYSSMLSRALILNQTAMAYSLTKFLEIIKYKFIFFLGIFTLIISMFLVNNYFSNHFRINFAHEIGVYIKNQLIIENQKKIIEKKLKENNGGGGEVKKKSKNYDNLEVDLRKNFKVSNDPEVKPDPINMSLFVVINRWIGIDSMLAIVSSDRLGFDLFFQSLKEKKIINQHTFYESTFNVDWDGGKEIMFGEKRILKGNTLPGIITVLFYTGNYLFLFISVFSIIFIFSLLEIFCLKISNSNMIFASFISFTIAFRLSNFGYAPADSYLYLISILASLVLIFILSNYKGLFFNKFFNTK